MKKNKFRKDSIIKKELIHKKKKLDFENNFFIDLLRIKEKKIIKDNFLKNTKKNYFEGIKKSNINS